jgi:gamma-glutamyltranspeptidase/glutathione hydrolase
VSAFTTRPELTGTLGMVAATHWLAAQSGMAVLEAGGNAFDAAVAAGLVLHVVEPHQNGLGGDAVLLCHSAADGRTFVVCGQGPAPAAATPDRFAAEGLELIPGSGLLPAVVPGAFGTWMHLLARYGTLRFADVLRFALGYAEDGFPLPANAVEVIAAVAALFTEHWTDSAALYLLPGGRVPAPDTRFRNPALARTLRRLLAAADAAGSSREAQIEAARAAFYTGFVAEEIDRYIRTSRVWDGTGEPRAGLLRYADLAGWRPAEEDPLRYDFRGFTVCKTGPWGQGPVLLQQLALLDGFDLADTAPGSAELVHTSVECAKLAFADRDAFYGDPRFTDVPLDALLSRAYTDERRRLVGPDASAELVPGSPAGRLGRLPRHGIPAGGPLPAVEPTTGVTRGDTCHLDVVDRAGNLVSATPSGGWLQSSPVLPELGFGLPTRAQMFDLAGGPNALLPGKRPRTTLSPGLVLRDGRPYLAFGTPGGDQQDQWPLVFLLDHLQYGQGLQAALDAPTWHTTHFPSSFHPRAATPRGLHAESRLGADVLDDLRRRGHRVTVEAPWSLGRTSAAGPLEGGLVRAAASPRSVQGYAVGR